MTTPKSTMQLDPTAFKENLWAVASDTDIPAGPGKESVRIHLSDVRPKVIAWDLSVPSPTIPANAIDGDILKVTVSGSYAGVSYIGGDDAAHVINKAGGLVAPLKKVPAVGGGGAPTSVTLNNANTPLTLSENTVVLVDASVSATEAVFPLAPTGVGEIEFLCIGGLYSINNLTLNRNGKPIAGDNSQNVVVTTDNLNFRARFIDNTIGWLLFG